MAGMKIYQHVQIVEHHGPRSAGILCFKHKFDHIIVVIQNDHMLIECPDVDNIALEEY